MWRKNFLDDPIKSQSVHGISFDPISIATLGLTSTGELTGADAAADAARAGVAGQERISRENIEFQKWLWGEQKEISEPWRAAGETALGQFAEQAGQPFTAEQMMQDPGYQFRLSEGMKGIETSAAARGMQLSGRTLKGIGRYAQDYASGEFQNAYARRQQGLSNLYNLASMGQAAASGQAQQGGIMGGQISQAYGQLGQAQMDYGQIGAAQAQAPFQSLMQIGGVGAMMYGAR